MAVSLSNVNIKTQINEHIQYTRVHADFWQSAHWFACPLQRGNYNFNSHKIPHLYSHYCSIHEASVFIFFIWFTVSARITFIAWNKVTFEAGPRPLRRHLNWWNFPLNVCVLAYGTFHCHVKSGQTIQIWSACQSMTEVTQSFSLFPGNKKRPVRPTYRKQPDRNDGRGQFSPFILFLEEWRG